MRFFLTALVMMLTGNAFAESPVGVESYLSNKGELYFRIQNYSQETNFDCVVSYDLRTYDEDHAYLRTAANLQTQIIYIEKGETIKLKADFTLEENEKIAELAHEVKAPNCVPATKSRAVPLKNYYQPTYVDIPPGNNGGWISLKPNLATVLKADFKDIANFEILAKKEIRLDDGEFISNAPFGGLNDGIEHALDGIRIFFLNDLTTGVNLQSSVIGKPVEQTLYYFNEKTKKIQNFLEETESQQCLPVKGLNRVICLNKDNSVSLLNPSTKESIFLNLSQSNQDPENRCGMNLNDIMFSLTSTGLGLNQLMINFEKKEFFNRDAKMEVVDGLLNVVSCKDISENFLKVSEIRKLFPKAAFMRDKEYFFGAKFMFDIENPVRDRYLAKDSLKANAERLFKKTISGMQMINTGKSDYFDLYFWDMSGKIFYGRMYWEEIR